MEKESKHIPIPNWSLSWRSYVCGTFSFWLHVVERNIKMLGITEARRSDIPLPFIAVQVIGFLVLIAVVQKKRFGIAWRAYLLGCTLNLGLTLATLSENYQSFGIYCIAMSIFHWSEYMLQSIYNPATTGVDSYMLYHSHAYVIAFFASMGEYWTEVYFLPSLKSLHFVINIGIMLVMFGEGLRKVAMVTAKSNFNHYVQDEKSEGHELVTHGVYSLFRHPSYVGWFWWSIGTQLILINPICMIMFGLASWKFFNERIWYEEQTLIHFFGTKYLHYQQQVATGIPFIKGYHNKRLSSITQPQ